MVLDTRLIVKSLNEYFIIVPHILRLFQKGTVSKCGLHYNYFWLPILWYCNEYNYHVYNYILRFEYGYAVFETQHFVLPTNSFNAYI